MSEPVTAVVVVAVVGYVLVQQFSARRVTSGGCWWAGVAWAWSTHAWQDAPGVVWAKGTRATAVVWLGGTALRIGLMGIGALIGVRSGIGALVMAMVASLPVRTGVLLWRSRAAVPAYRVSVAD